MTFVETLLGASAGETVTVAPDLIIVNDGSSYTAAEQAVRVKTPEKVRVFYDHDVPTGRPESSRIFGVLRDFSRLHGLRFMQAKGVAYQYLLTNEAKAGQMILHGGRHAGIYGSVGALGISGSPEVLTAALETGCLSVTVPETIHVRLRGHLQEGVSIMDAAMTLLRDCRELPGKAVELHAENLTSREKAILCVMSCESGAFTAAVTESEETDFLLELDTVVPMVTMPCASAAEQDRAVRQPLAMLEDTMFRAGQIGGYTGGTIEDLRRAAALLEGKRVPAGFRLSIVPATSEDYLAALKEGIITALIDCGAQIHAVGDRSIVMQGAGAMGSGENLLTTGLYTYFGCMGTEDSYAYTASVESVIRACLAGGKGV